MKDEDETKDKPKLKDLSDFKHEEEGFKLFDFQKAKETKDEDDDEDGKPKLKSKFCFKHDEDVFNFNLEPCADNYDVVFTVSRYIDHHFISGWMQQPVLHQHVELNIVERFMFKIGFKRFTVENKIEKVALQLKERILVHLNKKDQAKKLNKKFKL